MMELCYLYMTFLFNFVCASPYGYGTHGASTETGGATSSGLGLHTGFPLNLPLGSGFSGSFSKSSSASSSASSFSSSFSSSSFGFGDTISSYKNKLGEKSDSSCGASGCQNNILSLSEPFPGALGISETSSGVRDSATLDTFYNSECGSTNCQENKDYKNTNIPTSDEVAKTNESRCSSGTCQSSGHQLANVAGVAQGKGGSDTDGTFENNGGTSFGNGDEQSSSYGCKGSRCSSFHNNEPHLTESEDNHSSYVPSEKCLAGLCSPNAQKAVTYSPLFNTNDFLAKLNQAEPAVRPNHNVLNANEQQKTFSGCNSGVCKTVEASENPALSFTALEEQTYPSKCKTPDCTSYETSYTGSNIADVGYKEPVTFLQTPKETNCFPPLCQIEFQAGETEQRKNVDPIYEVVHTHQGDYYTLKNPSPESHYVPFSEASSSNCKTSNCVYPAYQLGIPETHLASPNYLSSGLTFNNPSDTQTSALHKPVFNIGALSNKPTINLQNEHHTPTKPNVQLSAVINTTKKLNEAHLNDGLHELNASSGPVITQPAIFTTPSIDTKPERSDKSDVYTGGFGGPPGLLKPNEYSFNATLATQQVDYSTALKPSEDVRPSDQTLPAYIGNFGGPSALPKPNKLTGSGPDSSEEQLSVTLIEPIDSTTPIVYEKPGNLNTISHKKQIEAVIPDKTQSGQTSLINNFAPFEHLGLNLDTKPIVDAKPTYPTYSSGFGGPVGLPKPNEFGNIKTPVNNNTDKVAQLDATDTVNNALLSKPTHQNIPTFVGGLNNPTESPHETELSTPHYAVNSNTAILSQEPNYDTKPTGTVKPSDDKTPIYTSGFGGSTGLLKPGEFDVSKPSVNLNTESSMHSEPSYITKPVVFNKLPNLSSTNIDASQPTETTKPNTPNFVSPPGDSNPYTLPQAAENKPLFKPIIDMKPFDTNLPTYTGGFGGPSGLFKPSEYNIVKPSSSTNTGMLSSNKYPYFQPSTDYTLQNQKIPAHISASMELPESGKSNQFVSDHQLGNANAAIVGQPGHSFVTSPITLANKPSSKPITINISKHSNQKLPTQTNNKPDQFHGDQSSIDATTHAISIPSVEKSLNPIGFDGANPSDNKSNDTGINTEHPNIAIPGGSGELSNQNLPPYTGGFSNQQNLQKPTTTSHTDYADIKVSNKELPIYSHGLRGPSLTRLNNGAVEQSAHPSFDNSNGKPLNVPSALLKPGDLNKYLQNNDEPVSAHSSSLYNSPKNFGSVPGYFQSFNPTIRGQDTSFNVDTNQRVDVNSAQNLSPYTNGLGLASTEPFPLAEDKVNTSKDYNKNIAQNQYRTEIGINADSSLTVAYAGGFGGPPGLLRPYDDGRLNSNLRDKYEHPSTQLESKYGSILSDVGKITIDSSAPDLQTTTNSNNQFPYSKSNNNAPNSSQGDLGVQKDSTSTAFVSSNNEKDRNTQVLTSERELNSGCTGGCRSISNDGGTNFASSGSFSKPGYIGDWNNSWNRGLSTATAAAKSTAGALSGAWAQGIGRSYASSSAFAHASSGYPSKGGYGK